MNSGKLRHRIALQSATETFDAAGQPVQTWATTKTVKGSIRTLSGKEYLSSDKNITNITHKILVRWIDGLTPKMRFTWNSRTFNIVFAGEDITHDRTREVLCQEVLAV